MAGYREVPQYGTETVAKGARRTIVLSAAIHLQILWMFAVENKRLDSLLNKYNAYVRGTARRGAPRARQGQALELAQWRPKGVPLRDDEAAWLQTLRSVQVLIS